MIDSDYLVDATYNNRGNQRGGIQRGGNQRGAVGFQRGGASNRRGMGTNNQRGRGGNFGNQNATNQSQPNTDLSRGGAQQKWGNNQAGGRGQIRGRGRGQRGNTTNT